MRKERGRGADRIEGGSFPMVSFNGGRISLEFSDQRRLAVAVAVAVYRVYNELCFDA